MLLAQARRAVSWALVGVIGLLAAVADGALAQPQLHAVSGTPYALSPACESTGVDGEVSLAVDRRSGRMVAAWMQDAQGLGDPLLTTNTVVTASSADGVTWSPSVAPSGVMPCDKPPPGPRDAVFDPSVSVGPDGRWYLARLGEVAAPGSPVPQDGTIYVSTSTDGTNWSAVPEPIASNNQDDYESVVADPATAGRAYVIWVNFPGTRAQPEANRILLSRTTDGGASFSAPTAVHQAPPGRVDLDSRLAVLGDGSLLAVFAQTSADAYARGDGGYVLYTTRSKDHGATWSAPRKLGSGRYRDVVGSKAKTVYAPFCCAASLSGGPGNEAHVVWATRSPARGQQVRIASSRDGGRSWKVAHLSRPARAFHPTVAATSSTVAATWYDFGGERPAGQKRPTTLWMARSGDRGATWRIDRLAGPFDLSTAEPVGGSYLGDFQSLVATKGGFEAAFTLASPFARTGATDIFHAAIPNLPRGGS